jgi:hypothetical protein
MLHGGDSLEFQFQQSCNITIHDLGSEKIEEKKTWSGLLPSMVVSVTCVVPHPLAHMYKIKYRFVKSKILEVSHG